MSSNSISELFRPYFFLIRWKSKSYLIRVGFEMGFFSWSRDLWLFRVFRDWNPRDSEFLTFGIEIFKIRDRDFLWDLCYLAFWLIFRGPLSSTHQFHSKGPLLFSPQKTLSSKPETPPFITKNPSVPHTAQFHTPLSSKPLSVSHQKPLSSTTLSSTPKISHLPLPLCWTEGYSFFLSGDL